MKNFLLTIAAVVTSLIGGSGIAWADTAWVYYNGSTSQMGGYNVANLLTTIATESKGFNIAITGTNTKGEGSAISNAKDITIDNVTRKSIKSSNSKQNTLYIPSGYTVNKITLYSYVNKTRLSGTTDNTETIESAYWSEVNGTTYYLSDDTKMTTASDEISSLIDEFSFEFADGVTDKLTFTQKGTQVGFIVKVEYSEVAATAASTPTILSPVFDFSAKSYTLTLAAKNEGETVKYTLNSGSETEATGAITVKNGDNLVYWAEAEGLTKSEKGTYTVSGLTEYASGKPYVAWVYQPDYKTTYTTDADPLYTALNSEYTVVPVACDKTKRWDDETSGCSSLTSADLVVVSELMAGGYTLSNSLVDVVGKCPVINLKSFNYTYNSTASRNRWGWGTATNQADDITYISPSAGNLKLFEGITVENGKANFFDNPGSGTHIQTVELTGKSAPSGTKTLGNVDGKIAIHTADKYVLLGLAANDFATANANAQRLIKNAAALLLAKENDASVAADSSELSTASFSKMQYASFYSETAAIIPNGVKAYIGVLSDDSRYLNLEEISGYIPAKTPVILEGTQGTPSALYSTIYTIAAAGKQSLSGTAEVIDKPTTGTVYTLGYVNDTPGFYKYTGSTLAANRAYLVLPAGTPAPAIRFSGVDADEPGNVTAIETVAVENHVVNAIYDLRGRRVLSLDRPGLYIVNGKKVSVK